MAVQRWATTLLGLAVVALAVWLVVRNFQPPKAIGTAPAAAAGDGKLGYGDGGAAGLGAGAGLPGEGRDRGDGGVPLLLSDLLENEPRMDGGAGGTMFDGTPVPPLPMDVPRSVRFGVVLVSYDGAQPSPTANRQTPRSKADARTLALKLAETAKQDFHAAVQQGDGGSSDDIGRVKLGILEPAPEYVLFTLPIDGVGGPVDTPRGYWIVKRLE
jgi:hypothetical protein